MSIIVRGYSGTVITRGYAGGPVPTVIISAESCAKMLASADSCAHSLLSADTSALEAFSVDSCPRFLAVCDSSIPRLIRNEVTA